MSKLRFIGIAGGLAGVIVAGLVLLAPATHGQAVTVVTDDDQPQVRQIEVLTGRGSQIGVTVREVDDADVKREKLASPSGAVVDEVRSGSPAEKAGFKAGDVVMSFDGERVRSARQFARLVEETPAGRSVKAEVMRDGRQTDLQVTPDGGSGLAMTLPRHGGWRGEWNMPAPGMRIEPFEFEFPGDGPFGLIAGRGRLGVGIQNLTPELAAHFGAKQGVLVNSVDPDSPGAKAGVKVGDVITSIDGSSVDDGGELRRKLWEQDDATEVTLGIVRDGKAMDLKVSLDGQRTGGGVGRTRRRV